MKTWICAQLIETRISYNDGHKTHHTAVLLRRVMADSKAEAIGKFTISTADIEARQRHPIGCSLLEDLELVE